MYTQEIAELRESILTAIYQWDHFPKDNRWPSCLRCGGARELTFMARILARVVGQIRSC